MSVVCCFFFFFSSRRRHTRCALVTGVQTCALPICKAGPRHRIGPSEKVNMSKAILVTGPDLDPLAAKMVADHGYQTTHTPAYADSDAISKLLKEDRKSTRLNSSH